MNPVWRALVCALCVLWPSAGLAAGAGDGSAAATAAVNAAAPATTVNQNVAQGGSANASSAQSAASSDGVAGAHATIPPGTTITMQNWQQYKQFMPDGMIALFEGKYFWKMPADVEMEVGPTVIHPLPATYLAATEKYASQVRLVTLPDGGLNIENYQGGIPFPNPGEPNKGWKILADFWFRYYPHLVVNSPESLGFTCTEDSYANIACQKSLSVFRQMSYNTDPGVPATIPGGEGVLFTFWSMIMEPEQSKYTSTLTIAYTDLTRRQLDYIFKPAFRRAEPLGTAARCNSGNLDNTPDDRRFGFNGNPPLFDAKWLRDGKILSLMDTGTAGGNFPQNFDMPLGWPKPSWGKWEVRDVHVIDVRRIPSEASGYCYGKRIMYVDKQWYGALWEDLYDEQLRFWKIVFIQPNVMEVPGLGLQNSSGAGLSHYWDIQNNHATFSGPNDGHGFLVLINDQAPKEMQDVKKYTSPVGLNEIMR